MSASRKFSQMMLYFGNLEVAGDASIRESASIILITVFVIISNFVLIFDVWKLSSHSAVYPQIKLPQDPCVIIKFIAVCSL